MEYNYPLDYSWNTEEIILVVTLFNAVEQAYETGIHKDEFMVAYKGFKQVVDSKSEEKQIDKEFEKISGYSIYRIVTLAKDNDWLKA
ncbi:MAG: UPF0223 family protein [Coprobacillaceae bacterium]